MKESTYELGKSFYEEEWNNEKIKVHSEIMMTLCTNIITNTRLNPDVFIIAGWLHDMGRQINKEKHEEHSLIFFEKFMNKHPQFKELEKEIKDCILNHRSTGTPETLYGQIFKVADKLSLEHNTWISWKEKQK